MASELQYTQYLDSIRSYTEQDQLTKAMILIGYVERDFIRFYRAGRIAEGVRFAEENLARSKDLLNRLTPEQKVAQLHALVDILSFEGIQNHVKIFKFVQLRTQYHQHLLDLPVTTAKYVPLLKRIITDFGQLAQTDGLAYADHLESTLDVIYYINAHVREKLTVKQVLAHVNQRCNPIGVQRGFNTEMHMSIRDYINVKKIREAQRILLLTTMRIGQIAQELNFYDAADFSKRFKRELGMTPLEYRQQNSEVD
ncbi:helix-turn-helix transcriptional regulator [Levilactobacillus yiduensis]|uniref:helix-turn-helix transcriptional regulator n=1 Tax=Levilactobacillus yiduensis TaxID=2953880 RepID=UPI000EF344B8|nr:AraC family transcriptional regulator [Levilactobacillus yiduensis]AYM02287.1 AraC family transcriptional regulator [Levilactobacillus brevis]